MFFPPLFGVSYISLILIKEEMTRLKIEQSTLKKKKSICVGEENALEGSTGFYFTSLNVPSWIKFHNWLSLRQWEVSALSFWFVNTFVL